MSDTLRLDEVVDFAENPEPRCPCVLLLDTSGSMQGAPIDALNQGLLSFKDELTKNPLASRRVEVSIVTFDSNINVVQDFVTADQFTPPILTAQGLTSMGAGIHKSLDLIQERKAQYRSNGVAYYRPWIFMITDGEPQGELDEVIDQASQRLQNDESKKRVAFFSVGVENANMTRLSQLAVRTPLKLKGLNFVEMFVWLSASMSAVSHSKVDEQVALPPIGWGSV
ncbi:MAG: VWA domain-containing protein [Cyanobacteria bacterium J06635_10]